MRIAGGFWGDYPMEVMICPHVMFNFEVYV
jgi:hypothetical protein